MKLNELRKDERAVSPVVGVALLIAMAVILAAVIGTAVLGLGSNPAESPQASFSFDYDVNNNGNVTITHDGGDALDASEITIQNESGTEVTPDGDTWTAGQNEEISAGTDETVRIIWEDTDSDKTAVLGEYTV